MKKKGSVIYIYVGFFLSAVLIILIGNSYFLIDRTRSNLIEIYWKQGELIVKSIAVSAQQSIASVKLNNHQIRRHLKKIVAKVEASESLSSDQPDLAEILENEGLHSIIVKDENSNIIHKEIRTETEKDNSKIESLFFDRHNSQGTIEVSFAPSKKVAVKTQIGLQILIASLENRNVVDYISFINDQFKIVADSDPLRVGITEEEIEYLDVLKSGVSYFFRDSDEDIMKIIHPMNFTPENRGILKIAYPITRIDKIYENTFKNVALNSSVVMVIAIVAAGVAVRLSRRNLDKIESMERRIRENEKLASLANLTAGVAHEVRNPLNSVSITIQRLQLEFTPKEEDDLEEYNQLTDLMKREVDRINLIITDFLDFAKPFKPKKSVFNIGEFIEETLEFSHAEAYEKGINLVTEISNKEATFLGDREKLTQVLINVVRNALDASGKYDPITIESHFSKDKSKWLLNIKDNGTGIDKKNLNHIFDIYFTTKKTGTGLGLYICRKIIQAHEGNIELLPNAGSGITVSISLPVLDF